MANVRRDFSEYRVGERWECGSKTVDQCDINLFAGLTLDFHPAHLDAVYADSRFGGRIAHGMLTFSIVTGLTVEYNEYATSYGYDRVRFPTTVHAGDTISATAEVVELREHKSGRLGLVVKQYQGTNQRGETVLSCQHILAVDRKAPEQ